MTALGSPTSPTPQPQSGLPQMLRLSWSKAPDMPQGMQDNDGGVIGNWLVLAGGFCGGRDNDWKPGMYPRGFFKKTWVLDLTDEARGWVRLPHFPGSARQEMLGISIDDAVYLWGGFNYKPPNTYRDGDRLTLQGDEWTWDRLPDLPWKITTDGICAIGPKVYVLGGHDYDGQALYTTTDRAGRMEGSARGSSSWTQPGPTTAGASCHSVRARRATRPAWPPWAAWSTRSAATWRRRSRPGCIASSIAGATTRQRILGSDSGTCRILRKVLLGRYRVQRPLSATRHRVPARHRPQPRRHRTPQVWDALQGGRDLGDAPQLQDVEVLQPLLGL